MKEVLSSFTALPSPVLPTPAFLRVTSATAPKATPERIAQSVTRALWQRLTALAAQSHVIIRALLPITLHQMCATANPTSMANCVIAVHLASLASKLVVVRATAAREALASAPTSAPTIKWNRYAIVSSIPNPLTTLTLFCRFLQDRLISDNRGVFVARRTGSGYDSLSNKTVRVDQAANRIFVGLGSDAQSVNVVLDVRGDRVSRADYRTWEVVNEGFGFTSFGMCWRYPVDLWLPVFICIDILLFVTCNFFNGSVSSFTAAQLLRGTCVRHRWMETT